LTALETGGNQQFANFLDFYSLKEDKFDNLAQRYQNPACDFYRRKLKELAE
jgi:hypothetical protein